jgi:hypothetical protein
MSGALTALNGSQPTLKASQNAVSQAQSAIVAAHGALAVLTVPSASSTLSQQAQLALTAVSGYDDAVSPTLSNPVPQNFSQLQTLATGAQSALIPINPAVPGAAASVSGTDNLLGWANGAYNRALHNAPKHPSQPAPQPPVPQRPPPRRQG